MLYPVTLSTHLTLPTLSHTPIGMPTPMQDNCFKEAAE